MLQSWSLLCQLSVSTIYGFEAPPPAPTPEPAAEEPAAEPAQSTSTDASVEASAATETPAAPMVIVRAGGNASDDHGGASAEASSGDEAPATPQVGAGTSYSQYGGGLVTNPQEWHYEFHGYFHAPMRIGIGEREDPLPGQGKRTFHAPLVPDDAYLSPQHTKHNPREWAELYFSYGNDQVRGVVSIEAFNFTDGNWNDQIAQFGITKAFIQLTPRLSRVPLRLRWKIGAADNRYGRAGRYDGGEYETYLFGRTRGLGETLRAELPVRSLTFSVEHGVGATRPDPNEYAMSRFTLLHHAHAGVAYRKLIDFNFHYLTAFAAEEDRPGEADAAETKPLEDEDGNAYAPDGRMTVLGPDIRLNAGRLGYLYAGYSWIKLHYARTVGPAIEVIHSNGAGNYSTGLVYNYLEGPQTGYSDPESGATFNDSNGNGSISTVLLQYEQSVKNAMKGDAFYGQSRDVGIRAYTMLNRIASANPNMDGVTKFKYGADVYFWALKWLGGSVRYDRVQPNSNLPEQSFSVLSPRLIFRTDWITHEEIRLQYSRYIYNRRTCSDDVDPWMCLQPPAAPNLPDGLGATDQNQTPGNRGAPLAPPDLNVIALQAAIWW